MFKKSFALLFILFSFCAFAKENPVKKDKEEAKSLRESLLEKKGVYFEKGGGVKSTNYLEILKGINSQEAPLSIKEGTVTVGDAFRFKPYVNIGSHGPDYAKDNLISIRFEIDIDNTSSLENIVKYLTTLPIDDELANSIKSDFTNSDKLIKSYGLDFYLASLMASMKKYPDSPKFILEGINALKKYPDYRVIPFAEDFAKDFTLNDEIKKGLEDLKKIILDKTPKSAPEDQGAECGKIASYSETIVRNADKGEVSKAIKMLGELECKEAVAYLYFLNGLSYVNEGDDLFNNPNYFSWDKNNLRYSVDLRKKELFLNEISASFRHIISKIGIPLLESFRLLAAKDKEVYIGPQSVYFDYLFRVPYKSEWELTQKELKSLINNSLFAQSGYILNKSGKIHTIAKN